MRGELFESGVDIARPGNPNHRSVDFGVAELRPDSQRPGGRILLVDGVPQSYVDMSDPTYLDFEYMRRFALVVDTAAPAGRPLRVIHLGGGAVTMARYVAATRPGSAQLVVERDSALVRFVAAELPLPAGVEMRVADARVALDTLADGWADLLLVDVYQAAQMPRSVASAEFAAQARRVLHPRGRYAANVADLPPLAFSRVQAATLRAAFGQVGVLADPGMLRGRRYGNVVLAAAPAAGGLPLARLAWLAARDPFPARVLHGVELDRFIAGAQPVADAHAGDGPVPPARRLL